MSQGPLNPETLESLKEYADPGDPGFLKDLFSTYLADAESRLAEIRLALPSGDAESIRRLAHTLEGSSLNVGADVFAGMMGAMVRNAKAGKLPDAGSIREAEAEFARVKEALAPYLA